MSDPACSLASLAANESLAGTAVESVDRWILLEVTDAWAPKVLRSEVFSDAVARRLTEWSEAPRSRLQLIRRPGRTGKRPLLMVVSASGDTREAELDAFDDLVDLDLASLPLQNSADPTVLVCVHGRRDRCCAQHGAAVYRSLQSRSRALYDRIGRPLQAVGVLIGLSRQRQLMPARNRTKKPACRPRMLSLKSTVKQSKIMVTSERPLKKLLLSATAT